MKPETKLYRNMVIRWKAELSNAQEISLVFSPFLTAPTVRTITNELKGRNIEFYTVFEAENFASGASSIREIKNLYNLGFSLYHLPKLHAKILLSSPNFASVGSQNITGKGTRNLEASFATNEVRQVLEVEKLVAEWVKDRETITWEMILDMEKLLKPISKLFVEAQKAALEIDLLVAKNEDSRRRAKELQEKLEKKRLDEQAKKEKAEQLAKLRMNISTSVQAQSSIYCRVMSVDTGSWFNYSSTSSLMATQGDNFLEWRFKGKPYSLDRLNRYVCLIEKSGKFGWARVAKSRMTFFNGAVSQPGYVVLNNINWRLSLHARWIEDNALPPHNLTISLKPTRGEQAMQVHIWFSLYSVDIVGFTYLPSNRAFEQLEFWINNNLDAFKATMLEVFLDSFTYEEKLVGIQARAFFGFYSGYYRASLHLIHDRPLYIISEF